MFWFPKISRIKLMNRSEKSSHKMNINSQICFLLFSNFFRNQFQKNKFEADLTNYRSRVPTLKSLLSLKDKLIIPIFIPHRTLSIPKSFLDHLFDLWIFNNFRFL